MLWSILLSAGASDSVTAQIDWQAHPAMHQTWPLLFSKGLTNRSPRRRWRHQFRQVMHEPYLDESGVRILLAAAMAAERARSPEQARALILKEFATVEAFVNAHSDRYVLATTPAQAREALRATEKMVVIHSIEGGHLLLNDPEDAQFWADQGVALMTLMHLRDDELGAAAMNPKWYGGLVNRQGARRKRREERRGLTEHGRRAIGELVGAGILVDFSHMAPLTVQDALEVTRGLGAPPLFTHGKLARITDTEQGITDAQFLEVYRQGGSFAMGLAGHHLDAYGTPPPEGICPGTLQSFSHHYATANAMLAEHPELTEGLSPEDAAIALSVGWSSDWNGWTHHSRPVYGRCEPRRDAEFEIDTRGLAHPGMLPQHWARMEKDGADLQPMLHSAEQFLRLWEKVRGERP